jgi:monoterpene epsilon-lactone hydrolase
MPSLQARIVEWLLPLAGAKRVFASEEAVRRDIVRIRRHGPALPGAIMRWRHRIAERAFGSCRVFTVAPRRAATSRHILYLHGGGYFSPIMHAHWSLVGRLVRRLRCTATVPLYPLAPEHTAREVIAHMMALAREILDSVGPANVSLMGDSAGGGMALALAQQLRHQEAPLPRALVLLSPWLDATVSDPRQPALAKVDRLLDIPGTCAAGRLYAGDLPLTDPRVSPLFGTLRGLPPIAVFTGTNDLLNPDARRLEEKAEREGAPLEFHEYDGMFHGWVAGPPIPETRQAIDEIAAFIERLEHSPPP